MCPDAEVYVHVVGRTTVAEGSVVNSRSITPYTLTSAKHVDQEDRSVTRIPFLPYYIKVLRQVNGRWDGHLTLVIQRLGRHGPVG